MRQLGVLQWTCFFLGSRRDSKIEAELLEAECGEHDLPDHFEHTCADWGMRMPSSWKRACVTPLSSAVASGDVVAQSALEEVETLQGYSTPVFQADEIADERRWLPLLRQLHRLCGLRSYLPLMPF